MANRNNFRDYRRKDKKTFNLYEMFSGSSLAIKEQTPFDMTFIISCSGPHVGYIPTSDAYEYDHGCYESQTSKIPQGTAEILVEKYVSMLTEIHTPVAE